MNARKPILFGVIIGLALLGIGIWLSVGILQSFGILVLFIIVPVFSIRWFRERLLLLLLEHLGWLACLGSLAFSGLLLGLLLGGIYLIYLFVTWIF